MAGAGAPGAEWGAIPGTSSDAEGNPLGHASVGVVGATQGALDFKLSDGSLLARDGRRFAVDLYDRLAANPGNILISPWSIRTALQMAYAGARGRTEQQMSAALHDSLGQSRLHLAASRVDAELRPAAGGTQPPSVELFTANAAWVAADLRLEPSFADTLAARYAAPPRPIDFGNADPARATINAWVEEQTRSRIRDLIPPGAIDPDTRLTLCDAIYFRGAWSDSFRSSETKDGLFHLRGGETATVPLMRATMALRYAENRGLQVVELPYAGRKLAMLVILPRAADGLESVERRLDPDSLQRWISRMKGMIVHTTLPRFRMENEFRLEDPLAAMGMADAFSENADFTGISPERPLYISGVFHKTSVAVDEHGAEAAAATAVGLYRGGSGGMVSEIGPPVTFNADHPFLFLIYHRPSGMILFIGRLADPR